MRRILYSTVDVIAKKYRDNIFSNLKIKPIDNLKKLQSKINSVKCKGYKKYINYIDEIIKNFCDKKNPEDLLLAKPLEVKKSLEKICSSLPLSANDFFCKHANLNLSQTELENKTWGGSKNTKQFNDAIIDALRYDYVRNSPNGFVSYFDDLKIKSCVYCNASYIVNANVKSLTPKGKARLNVMGRYELDHFLPKSQFPFLCVSFYNLQPSCPFCNRWKSIKDSDFNLYTDDLKEEDPFEFDLSPKVISSLSIDKRKNVINVLLNCNDPSLKVNHDSVFHLEDLYKSFDDEVEDLLRLKNAQTKGAQNNILQSFKGLFKNEEVVRILYGFYEDENIHKRPLSKLKLDLAKKLKLY